MPMARPGTAMTCGTTAGALSRSKVRGLTKLEYKLTRKSEDELNHERTKRAKLLLNRDLSTQVCHRTLKDFDLNFVVSQLMTKPEEEYCPGTDDLKDLMRCIKIRPNLVGAGRVDDGTSLLHMAVVNHQVEFLTTLVRECKKYPKQMKPVNFNQKDSDGKTPLMLACEKEDRSIALRLIMSMHETKGIWITKEELIKLANVASELIAPYLNKLGFSPPHADVSSVAQDCKRFPLEEDQRWVVTGDNDSTFVEGLWTRQKRLIKTKWREMTPYRRMDHCISDMSPAHMFGKLSQSRAAEARVIGLENFAGPINLKDPTTNVLLNLYQTEQAAIFGTKQVQVLLDLKWESYAGAIYRRQLFRYILYLIYYMWVVNFSYHYTNTQWTDDSMGSLFSLDFLISWIDLFSIILVVWTVINMGAFFQRVTHFKQTAMGRAYDFLEILNFVLVLIGVVGHLYSRHIQEWNDEKIFAALGALLQWFNLIFRMRGSASWGPFVRFLVQIASDMRVFMILLILCVMAFAQAFKIVFSRTDEVVGGDPVLGVGTEFTPKELYWFLTAYLVGVLGEVEGVVEYMYAFQLTNDTGSVYTFVMRWLIFGSCAFFMFVIMMNLLITIMGGSYETVIEGGTDDDWRMEQACTILHIEHSFNASKLANKSWFPRWIHLIIPVDTSNDMATILEDLHDALSDLKGQLNRHLPAHKNRMRRLRKGVKSLADETRGLVTAQALFVKADAKEDSIRALQLKAGMDNDVDMSDSDDDDEEELLARFG